MKPNTTIERFPRTSRDDPARSPDVLSGPHRRERHGPRWYHWALLIVCVALTLAMTMKGL